MHPPGALQNTDPACKSKAGAFRNAVGRHGQLQILAFSIASRNSGPPAVKTASDVNPSATKQHGRPRGRRLACFVGPAPFRMANPLSGHALRAAS